jgi:hypothetical protein
MRSSSGFGALPSRLETISRVRPGREIERDEFVLALGGSIAARAFLQKHLDRVFVAKAGREHERSHARFAAEVVPDRLSWNEV